MAEIQRELMIDSDKPFRVLGIETSCDETSLAVLECSGDDVKLLHHEIASQIPVHAVYGGVVPEVAARLHVAEILALIDRVKEKFVSEGTVLDAFDGLAVTKGPGLATALRVGVETARTLAFAEAKPIVGVNHLEGHIASLWLNETNRASWKFPALILLVSGGHTEIVLMRDFGVYEIVGRTRDDAAGEAFDKTAALMGLGYPGGPAIASYAEQGKAAAFSLPRPMLHDGSFDFSFSGLKTAVRNVWENFTDEQQRSSSLIADLCASVQEAIVDVLATKTIHAIHKYEPSMVGIAGGVSANKRLQERIAERCALEIPDVRVLEPARGLHTDNAAMIAAAGYWHLRKGQIDDWHILDADPNFEL